MRLVSGKTAAALRVVVSQRQLKLSDLVADEKEVVDAGEEKGGGDEFQYPLAV